MSQKTLDATLAGLIEIRTDLRNLQNGNMEIDRQPITDKINQLAVDLKEAGAKVDKAVEAKAEAAVTVTAPATEQQVANPITEIHQTAAENTQNNAAKVVAPPLADIHDAGKTQSAEATATKTADSKATASKSDAKSSESSKSTSKAGASKK